MTDIVVIGARGIPDAEGGAEKHAEKTFPLFAQRGYSVRLLGLDHCIRRREYKGVELRGLPTLRIANTDKLVYHVLALLHAAVTRPRLVHLQGLNSALFLVLYKLLGLRVVLRYGSADHLYGKWGPVGRLGFQLCEAQLRFADRIIAVSEKYRAELRDRYGLGNVELVPNGIDASEVSDESLAYWTTLGLEPHKYVLAVGRITIDKDYETLVRAMKRLAHQGTQLVVAGGISESEYAERLFAAADARVRFIGRVERRLLAALYDRCAVFVSCSRHEGLSNATLEAISFRRPLVVSDIPANLEMPLPKACYFPVGNVDALAARIDTALDRPEEFCAERADFCDWQEVFERTERIYRNLLPALVPHSVAGTRHAPGQG
jgi:glycosyltransferase involved in cell wall biosynthesis